MSSENPLLKIIENGLDHSISKWHHYLPLYHEHFKEYRNKASPDNKVIIVEIGVWKSGSLDMWNEYFGKENCEIIGVDCNEDCKMYEKDNIKIFIANQDKTEDLQDLMNKIPRPDILIDDGGHLMQQQIKTFDILFNHVKMGGIYLCEDTHTSYWSGYGGGLRGPYTFMEHTKVIIDHLNGYHYNSPSKLTQTCLGIYIYDSMVFFKKSKQLLQKPTQQIWHPKPKPSKLASVPQNKNLYLDIMKKTLTDSIYTITPNLPQDKKNNIENGCVWPDRAHTMIGLKRLDNIQFCIENIIENNVEGDIIETGVWRGGGTIFMKAVLRSYGDNTRKVFVADSFEGLPPPDENYPADRGDMHHKNKYLAVSKEQVEANFKSYDLLDENVIFIKGFFEHSLANAPIEKLSILRLDGDMYSSTIQVLDVLYDKVSIGGYIIVDDFALDGCKKAIEDFRAKRQITDEIHTIDWTGVYWKKTK